MDVPLLAGLDQAQHPKPGTFNPRKPKARNAKAPMLTFNVLDFAPKPDIPKH